ncbi:MAG: hypothetical protein KC438_00265 [Thermomicrobiales bacterium]|nr:hypothetical protein [Thermomicrobiales bacterium]MCO5221431.1 hypothetical protein [Thermomicrobiales bacterium]
MFQSPALQQQLAREIGASKTAHSMQPAPEPAPEPTESMLDSLVRRLRRLIETRLLKPLASEAS